MQPVISATVVIVCFIIIYLLFVPSSRKSDLESSTSMVAEQEPQRKSEKEKVVRINPKLLLTSPSTEKILPVNAGFDSVYILVSDLSRKPALATLFGQKFRMNVRFLEAVIPLSQVFEILTLFGLSCFCCMG